MLQRASLDYGVPRLAPGGVYICEDIIDVAQKESIVHYAASKFMVGAGVGFFPFHWSRAQVQTSLTDAQRELFGMSVYPHILVVEKMTTPRAIIRDWEVGSISRSGDRPAHTHMG